VVGIAAIVSVVLSGQSARKERDYALQQRGLAVSAANSMIDDVASALQTMSAPTQRRLDLLSRVAAVFDRLDATNNDGFAKIIDLDGTEGQAAIRTSLGLSRTLLDLGNFKAAMHRAEEAESKARKLETDQPANLNVRLLLAETLIVKSQVQRAASYPGSASSLDQAIVRLQTIDRIKELDRVVRKRVDTLLCEGYGCQARLLEESTNDDQIQEILGKAVQFGQGAYVVDPFDPDVVNAYANAFEALGSYYTVIGRDDVAVVAVQQGISIRRKAVAQSPGDSRLQFCADRMAASWASISDAIRSDDNQEVTSVNSTVLLRKMCLEDPENADLQADLADDLANHGAVLYDRHEFKQAIEAIGFYSESIEILKKLRKEGKASKRVNENFARCASYLSIADSWVGEFADAESVNSTILEPLARELDSRDPNDIENNFRLRMIFKARAEVAAGLHDWKSAQSHALKEISFSKQNVTTRGRDIDKFFYAESLVDLGKWVGCCGDDADACQYILSGIDIMQEVRQTGEFQVMVDAIPNELALIEDDLRYFQSKLEAPEPSGIIPFR
jgi:tetratricopeptide (TPR) repeat protein